MRELYDSERTESEDSEGLQLIRAYGGFLTFRNFKRGDVDIMDEELDDVMEVLRDYQTELHKKRDEEARKKKEAETAKRRAREAAELELSRVGTVELAAHHEEKAAHARRHSLYNDAIVIGGGGAESAISISLEDWPKLRAYGDKLHELSLKVK